MLRDFTAHSRVSIENPRDIAKILLISTLVQAFFLFTANYALPGGALEFFAYADALLNGQKAPHVFSRDIGFPLLLILSGYYVNHSLIGLTIIQALMGVVTPVLIYLAVAPFSRVGAYYTALASIVTLSPYFFFKWIHHDQAFVFFCVVTIWTFCRFVAYKRPKDLYWFTLAIIAASLTRPAGNLLFPVFIILAYLAARAVPLRHYVACVLLFVGAIGAYQMHRYVILDMANRKDIPSYTGQQIFYNLYMNSKEYGITLSQDLGPGIRAITDKVHDAMLPEPRSSETLKRFMNWESNPSDFTEKVTMPFLNKYFFPYSAIEFRSQLYREPNWEYSLLMTVVEPNDQLYRKASWEVVRAYPLYPLKYAARNLWLFLYEPGYFHTRFNPVPLFRGGQFFPFDGQAAIGGPIFGGAAAALGLPPRAAREIGTDSLATQPDWVKQLYGSIKSAWFAGYDTAVRISLALMLFAWLYVVLYGAAIFIPSFEVTRRLAVLGGSDLVAPIICVSVLLMYNALATAVFAEPDYRYHHMIVPIRVVLAGLGGIAAARLLSVFVPRRVRTVGASNPVLLTAVLTLIACLVWIWHFSRQTN
jgi:hypothetical protein